MQSIWQLTRQTLMADLRRTGSHVTRLGLMVVLYMAVTAASWKRASSAAGLSMFHAQLLITAFYLTINAIFGFSQAISEEKEDGTLGLMRLADVSPWSIILGKMAGRLVDAGLLLAIQFPFTIVAITLGGVSWAQIYAAYTALAAYLWLLATLGIAASVIQPTGSRAAGAAFLLLAPYVIPPYLIFTRWVNWQGLVGVYEYFSLPLRLSAVTESSFNESPWCWPVLFGVAGGVVFLLVSWWEFDLKALEAEQGTRLQKPARATRDTAPVHPSSSPVTKPSSRRVWSHPVIWREFTYLTGGVSWLWIRSAAHVLILFLMVAVQDSTGHVFAWAALMSGLLSVIDGTWSTSRLFRDEIRDRTWSSLVQAPHSIARLSFDKYCGWAMGLSPSIVFPYLYIVITMIVHEVTSIDLKVELYIGSITVGLSIVAYLQLLVLMSLYFGWKATPLTLTITFGSGWLYVMAVFGSRADLLVRCVLFLMTCAVMVVVMVCLQFFIQRRLRVLAETA